MLSNRPHLFYTYLPYLTLTGFKYQLDIFNDDKCKKQKFAYVELISYKAVTSAPKANPKGGFDFDMDIQIDSVYVTLYGVLVTLVTLLCPKADGSPWVEGKRERIIAGCPAVGLPPLKDCKVMYGMVNWKDAAGSDPARVTIGDLIKFKAWDPKLCMKGTRNRSNWQLTSHKLYKYADAPRITVLNEPIFADPTTKPKPKPKPPKEAPVDGTKPTQPVDTVTNVDAVDGTGTLVAKPWAATGVSANEGFDNNGDSNKGDKNTTDGKETGASKGKGKGNSVDWSSTIVITVAASAVLFLAFSMYRKRSEAAQSVSRLQSIPTTNHGGGGRGGGGASSQSESEALSNGSAGARSGKRITLNPMSEMPGVELSSMRLHD
jgi:hypothetical protein